jgi:hypothetical protein
MHTTPYRKTSHLPRLRKTGLALFLASACGLFASAANAQWAVFDSTTNETALEGLANDLKELQAEYSELTSAINGLTTGMSLVPNQLQQITDPSTLIQANCQSSSGSGLAGIAMNALSSLNSQSITASQQQICVTIVTTQIDKYNKTVALLNDMGQYNNLFQQLQKVNAAANTLADSSNANNQTQVYTSAMNTEMSNWHAQMEADDAIISTLQQQQDMLSRVALNGGGGGMLSTSLPDSSFQSIIPGIQ